MRSRRTKTIAALSLLAAAVSPALISAPARAAQPNHLTLAEPWARLGETLHFTGTGWAPLSAVTGELCDANQQNCRGLDFVSAGIADLNGNLSGIGTVGALSPTGHMTVGINNVLNPTAYAPLLVLGSPKASADPATVPLNSATRVTGTNFDPGSHVVVTGLHKDGSASTDPPITVTADPNGTAAADFTVHDPATTTLRLTSTVAATTGIAVGPPGTTPPGSPPPGTTPPGGTTTNPAPPSSSAPGGSTTTGGGAGGSPAPRSGTSPASTPPGVLQLSGTGLGPLVVWDGRAGTQGWSLTGTLSGSGMWTPACLPQPGQTGSGTVTPGTAGPLGGDAQTLCTESRPFTDTPQGGLFVVSPGVSGLSPGAVLTLTLS